MPSELIAAILVASYLLPVVASLGIFWLVLKAS